MCAAGPDSKWGLVEIDTDLLPNGFSAGGLEAYLYPDEDFLEQVTRGHGPCPEGRTMEERTAWFRENLLGFHHVWEDSIKGLGNCACLGEVPAECITKAVIFEPESNPIMAMMSSDPQITLMNYAIMGGSKYRALTDWFFGYDVKLSDFDSFLGLLEVGGIPESMLHHTQQRARALQEAMSEREGIEVLQWNTTR